MLHLVSSKDYFIELILFLTPLFKIKIPKDVPNELLYGRAGFLWACSFLNKNIAQDTVSSAEMVRIYCDSFMTLLFSYHLTRG